ncbi:hypothetical protein Q7P37_008274 [Cladosporium fusiforme]
MLPTPSTSHISFDNIYEPAEDSYLLLDTLSSASEKTFLSTQFPPTSPSPLVLEVGVGSGVVLAFTAANAHTIFNRTDLVFLGTDVNPLAASAASETVRVAISESAGENSEKKAAAAAAAATPAFLSIALADLTSPLLPHQTDVLIFNPPYVPTETLPTPLEKSTSSPVLSSSEIFARDSHLLELSYAGGVDGMETTDRLLAQLPTILSARGVAYILLCAQNKPEVVKAGIRQWPGGWKAETVGSSGMKAGWEKLVIVRVWRG